MATSSINADFTINDGREAKAFVSALLSESRPMEPPRCKPGWKFVNSVSQIERSCRRSRVR